MDPGPNVSTTLSQRSAFYVASAALSRALGSVDPMTTAVQEFVALVAPSLTATQREILVELIRDARSHGAAEEQQHWFALLDALLV